VPVPDVPRFDPSKVGKRPKAETESSTFKGMKVQRTKDGEVARNANGAVVLEAGSLDTAAGAKKTDVASGFTVGGRSVSLEEASRTNEDEVRARAAATRRHFRA
jgi:hypothetical protein